MEVPRSVPTSVPYDAGVSLGLAHPSRAGRFLKQFGTPIALRGFVSRGFCGGQGRNRTADAGLFRAALYQLSYLASGRPYCSKSARRNRTAGAGDVLFLHRTRLGPSSPQRQVDELIPPLFCLRCRPYKKERFDDLPNSPALRNNEIQGWVC